MDDLKSRAKNYSISKGFHPDARRTSHAAKNIIEAFQAGYNEKVVDEKLQTLSECYAVLSEIEEIFGNHSKHKAKTRIDKFMRTLITDIEILRNEKFKREHRC